MRNQACPKPDCMYLHDLGDQEASFTKEEMHQGKHQEYERKLVQSLHAHASVQRYTIYFVVKKLQFFEAVTRMNLVSISVLTGNRHHHHQ